MTKFASEGMEAWAVARENDDYTSSGRGSTRPSS